MTTLPPPPPAKCPSVKLDTLPVATHYGAMKWLHEPRQWKASENGLVVTADPQTDFWRITHDGGVRDNGHFYFDSVEGDCTATVHLEGDFGGLYDHAGIMLRLDEKNWIKCGIEYFEGQCHRSVVVTREFSDWSFVSQGRENSIWIRLKRVGVTVEISVSDDGRGYTLLRQAYFPDASHLDLGLMAAAPKGEGFEARFRGLEIA